MQGERRMQNAECRTWCGRRPSRALLLVGVVVSLVSCGDVVSPPSSDGELSATIGASGFTATTVFAEFDESVFTMSALEEGSSGPRSITITIRRMEQAGTYDLALSGNAGGYAEAVSEATQSWLCATSQGAGSVVITELSSARIAGTFSFSAPALITSGAMGTKVVSSGSFDVKPWRE